jgi:hypothetical protein
MLSPMLTVAGRPPTPEHLDTLHVLAASYYSLNDGLSATLMLSNQGPHSMNIDVTLFALDGSSFAVPTVTLPGNTVHGFELRDWLNAANVKFREGSLQVRYDGKGMELGGVVRHVDAAHSIIFDEELSEPAHDFASSRLEGVWWLPTPKSEVRLVVSNTTDASVTATVTIDGMAPPQRQLQIFTLAAHETQMLDVQDFATKSHSNVLAVGGISIGHTGQPGALLARAFIEKATIGYSNVVDFADPQKAKSSRLDGAGLRIGRAGNEKLRSLAVARNIGGDETTITGRISYTRSDGTTGQATLEPLSLRPNEARQIDMTAAIAANRLAHGISAAGLEFEYTTAPGTVLIAAESVSASANQVFRVPLVDVGAQHSSSGKYPWSMDSSSSTFVYLKNASDHSQQYNLQINYAGGSYALGLKTLSAGQAATVDVRRLRDDKIPDIHGNLLPANASGGQIIWSVYGAENRVIVGRAEQADIVHGVSMTAACPTCCPNSFSYAYIDPGGVTGLVGDFTLFRAYERDQDCYGNYLDPFSPAAQWWSSDTSVATCDGDGGATAVGLGATSINAYWFAPSWYQLYEECEYAPVDNTSSASCDVVAPAKLVRFNYTAQSPGAPDGYGPLLLTANTNNEVRNVKNEAIKTNQCGAYRNLVYELVDQNGDSITFAYSITENFSNYAHSTSYSSGTTPPSDTKNISANGIVGDTMYLGKTLPDCLGQDDNESFDQSFVVKINGTSYNLSTVNHVSRGRFSGTYKVDVTITTP